MSSSLKKETRKAKNVLENNFIASASVGLVYKTSTSSFSEQEIIKFYDYDKKITLEDLFTINKATKYVGKDNKLADPDSFTVGVIVEVTYDENSNIVSKLKVSPKSWTKTNVTDFEFDYINNVCMINNVNYLLDKEYTLCYKDGKASYKDLSDGNVIISVSGYDKTILGITITEYLGRIELNYPDNLSGALVSIGNNKIVNIEDLNKTFLKPDDYLLVITKKGIDDISLRVKVNENEVTKANVSDVTVKTTLLEFNVNKSDYVMTIKSNDGSINKTYTDSVLLNGELLTSNTLTLPYDIYVLTFSKEGYKTVTKKVELNGKTKSISVNFTNGEDESDDIGNVTSSEKAKITISTDPSDAQIYIDDEYIKDGKVSKSLTLGTHKLKITKSGYQGIERTIEVVEDKEYKFILQNDNAFESPNGEIVED